jgi:hypothetical protein
MNSDTQIMFTKLGFSFHGFLSEFSSLVDCHHLLLVKDKPQTEQQLRSANFSKYQTGVHYMGLKIFDTLPVYIKQESDNSKKFESLLKKFVYVNSFYSLEEFYRLLKS